MVCENVMNQITYQITIGLKITFKLFKKSLIEAYINVEGRAKLNNKTSFDRKILTAFSIILD